jgi:hypothetical protein
MYLNNTKGMDPVYESTVTTLCRLLLAQTLAHTRNRVRLPHSAMIWGIIAKVCGCPREFR